MSIINNGLLLASGADAAVGYQISRSIRLNSADSAYFSRTPGSAGNQKTYTLSMWIKRSKLGQKYFFGSYFSNLSRYQYLGFNSSDQLEFFGGVYTTGGSTTTHVNLSTTSVYRDVSAWYHLVLAVDTTQATSTNRVKLYVNGTQVTDFGTATYPAQNSESYINSVQAHYLGDWGGGGSISLDGYIADVYLLDGTATTPSTFAETDAITGQWVPKTPTSISYGTNGFRLTFSDNSGTTSTTLGKDAAGSNNWSPNNFSVASGSGNDSLVDSPTSYGTDARNGGEVRGNYATLNPLDKGSNINAPTNGNLDVTTQSSGYGAIRATIGVSSGKWYWEFTANSSDASTGLCSKSSNISTYMSNSPTGYVYISNGYTGNNENYVNTGTTYTTNDIIGVAFDADNGTLNFYKNNSLVSSATFTGISSSNGPYFPVHDDHFGSASSNGTYNFGARAFSYQAPSGYKALCDTNLTAPTIAKPANYFDITLWTGNSTNGRAITGLAFQPEFVWIKRRSASYGHLLHDAVRGFDSGWAKQLSTDSTAAEAVGALNGISSFDTGGFTLGVDGGVNFSGSTYVAWAWDAASSNSTNTSGTITSTVRANATAGFSIVTYTADSSTSSTVGHGLNAAPKFLIYKLRNATSNWEVRTTVIDGSHDYLFLNTTDAKGDSGLAAPTSTVFTNIYGTNNTVVVYAFAPVAGYSAFGSYTGNGSTDGPFVFTGFRVRWLMYKSTAAGGNWIMLDAARDSRNVASTRLLANTSDSEGTGTHLVDFLSNGFKIRNDDTNGNTNAQTYVWAAFAESPFQYARAR